jgi:4-amino-4-deoxy-L-arabinose transferase-like glycosyltransferase
MNALNLSHRTSWLWIVPLLVIWFSLFLGNRPYATPDEGRYVEIPREMVATGNYVTPRLNGVKYFEKPPLFYWIQAGNIKLLGTHEWSMRLGSILFAVIGCLGTFLFTRKFYGAKSGVAACFILATSPLYYALSRLLTLDMPMTALVSLSLFSFLVTDSGLGLFMVVPP